MTGEKFEFIQTNFRKKKKTVFANSELLGFELSTYYTKVNLLFFKVYFNFDVQGNYRINKVLHFMLFGITIGTFVLFKHLSFHLDQLINLITFSF